MSRRSSDGPSSGATLRHCFASNHLAFHGDIDRLCRELGHSSYAITRNRYATGIAQADAAAYWRIGLDWAALPVEGAKMSAKHPEDQGDASKALRPGKTVRHVGEQLVTGRCKEAVCQA